jgi:hypothetical protein
MLPRPREDVAKAIIIINRKGCDIFLSKAIDVLLFFCNFAADYSPFHV